MLKKLLQRLTDRARLSTEKSFRKISIGQCAAHTMVLHLCGLNISAINATGNEFNGALDKCLLRAPEGMEEIVNIVRCTLLAQAAENEMVSLAQDLLRGKSLAGFCDDNKCLLKIKEEVMAKADAAYRNSFNDPRWSSDERAWFVGILARRVVAHYYLAIAHLAAELIKTPLIVGENECRELIEKCLQAAPINSLKLVCANDA
ncbi:MAG: hypothetical protein WEC00_12010 [Dongiaceae bacterium]